MEPTEEKREARMIDADLLISMIRGMSQCPAQTPVSVYTPTQSFGVMSEIEKALDDHLNEKINQCFQTYTNNLINAIQASVSEDLPCLFCRNELKDKEDETQDA